ncbi:hypothetical protein [Microseira wollei]|uniref:Uncharacterized protein n=1 Tax=Microseira wollei NIES-4236 TaxID=2530354 RepID=A0AAV3XRD5_9CYAN|nr:hypothetical protein [Microseira wollei]GET42895.1 hypothetical protein MiSe_77130 [Microseira wollei NIES-4236]
MISTPKSVPELLRESILDLPGKHPIRLLACGVPKGVENVVNQLYVVRFAQVSEWSPPLPSPVKGEVKRILTRYWVE